MAAIKYAVGRPSAATSALAGDFIVPSSVSGSSPSAGFALADVRHEHLRREVRFPLDATDKTITFNTSSQEPDAVFVEDVNTTQITVNGATVNLSQNPRTKRYSVYYEPVSGVSTTWSVVLKYASRLSGVTYLGCGRISMVASGGLKTMVTNWAEPYRFSTHTLGSDRTLPGGFVESTSTSDLFLAFDMQGTFPLLTPTTTQHPLAYASLLQDERILHFEGRDDDTNKVHAYLLRRTSDPTITQEFPSLDIAVGLTEVI